jgi:hypothetical protein
LVLAELRHGFGASLKGDAAIPVACDLCIHVRNEGKTPIHRHDKRRSDEEENDEVDNEDNKYEDYAKYTFKNFDILM